MFKRILVAFDGSDHARLALEEAVDLARASDGEVSVLTVVPESSSLVVGGAVPSPVNVEELHRGIVESYRRQMVEAVDAVPSDVKVGSRLALGQPGPEIVDQARAEESDLVAVGSRGRGRARSLFLGSVSQHVSHASPVPVLIVHAPGDEA